MTFAWNACDLYLEIGLRDAATGIRRGHNQ